MLVRNYQNIIVFGHVMPIPLKVFSLKEIPQSPLLKGGLHNFYDLQCFNKMLFNLWVR